MSSTDLVSAVPPPEDRDADVKGRKFETTTEATCDIEVKPVELLISEPNKDDVEDEDDVDDDAAAAAPVGGLCSLSSREGSSIVLL